MGADHGKPMRQARHLDGQRKRALVLAAVQAAVQQGQVITIAAIARRADVGRKFIYDHPDLRAHIELNAAQAAQRQANDMVATARVTGASLRADLENARSQNRRLQHQLRALESRLSQLEGARLVADDLLPDDVVAQLADRHLAQQVADLEEQLFHTRDELRHATEELEAARAVNRELMIRANRTDAKHPSDTGDSDVTPDQPRRRRPAHRVKSHGTPLSPPQSNR
jgi:chromosome segregation ATPase